MSTVVQLDDLHQLQLGSLITLKLVPTLGADIEANVHGAHLALDGAGDVQMVDIGG